MGSISAIFALKKAAHARRRQDDNESAAAGHAQRLIRVTIEEIARADAKAGMLFTGTGVILGAIASVLIADHSRFADLPPSLEIPLLISVVCAIAALGALGAAAYPRGVRGSAPAGGRVMYFGDVVALADDNQLRKALGSALEPTAADLARQLRQLSLIVFRKYYYIRVASVFFAIHLAAILAAVIEAIWDR